MKHEFSCSAHSCHVFQYLSDIYTKKNNKKGKENKIQIVNRKENMIGTWKVAALFI